MQRLTPTFCSVPLLVLLASRGGQVDPPAPQYTGTTPADASSVEARASPRPETVVDDAAMATETHGLNCLAFGRTYNEHRFSPLTQMHDGSIARLGVDWYADLPDARGSTSTLLVVDGTMFFVESMNRVRDVAVPGRDVLIQRQQALQVDRSFQILRELTDRGSAARGAQRRPARSAQLR